MRLLAIAPPDFAPLAHVREAVETVVASDAVAVREVAPGCDAILLAPRYGALLRETWDDVRHVRWIHALAAGVETLPFDLLRGSDVIVTNSKGIYADALGEFAIAAMLWFAKDLRRLDRQQAAARWEPFTVERVEGKTLGVIGYGGIGSAIGRRAKAMGLTVLASSRTGVRPSGPAPRTGVRASRPAPREVDEWFLMSDVDALIARSDYVALSTPLTNETRALFNATRIAAMKEDAVLINVSRGAVVDENALIEALRAKRIRGAALDVFTTEPLPADSPLWSLDNVLLSPHSADHTADSHDRAVAFFLENVERYRRGEELANLVDKVAEY